jgi:predicted GIY-YIG superfamily endonuclease
MTTHYVYRLYSEDGVLLYIGMTNNADSRVRVHRNQQFWGAQIARVETEEHPGREVAAQAERLAIDAEKPAYNHTYNPAAPAKNIGYSEDDELMPNAQVAEHLGIDRSYVRHMMRRHGIPEKRGYSREEVQAIELKGQGFRSDLHKEFSMCPIEDEPYCAGCGKTGWCDCVSGDSP